MKPFARDKLGLPALAVIYWLSLPWAFAATLTFQNGQNGYAGAQDTTLNSSSPNASAGGFTTVTVVASGGLSGSQGLLKFAGIVGNSANQIPQNSVITSARILLRTTSGQGNSSSTIGLFRMLTNWNETSTWNSMNGGVSTDDVEASSAIDVTFVPNTSVPFTLNLTSTGITATVQAWVNGTAANQGWLFLNSGADNYIFNSSDDVAVNRPALLVSFTAPEPAITAQPADQSVCPTNGATFAIAATGAQPLSYQWFLNGARISGATSSVYNITSTHQSDLGSYFVVVSNSFGITTSSTAGLSFTTPTISCPTNIIANVDPGRCTKTNVTYSLSVSSSCDTNLTVSCNKPSGSTFSAGVTTVLCTARDSFGSLSGCAFTVTIVETVAPAMTCPTNIVVNADPGQCSKSNLLFSPLVTDNCDTNVAVTCVPPSGSTFQHTTTTVNCTARDSSGNTSTCSFTVFVRDAEPPQLFCPGSIVVNADAGTCFKTNVTYTVTASDNCGPPDVSPQCTPPSGSTFQKGTTNVTCSVFDPSGNTGFCSFPITVLDNTPPLVTCPPDRFEIATTANGTPVYFGATATDRCDPNPTIVCSPPSGTVFPFGATAVHCNASDASGNHSICAFNVTVAPASCCQGRAWTSLGTNGPGNRSGHAMAYDSARGRIVLFGGSNNAGFLNDIWEWNGTSWTQVISAGRSAPSARAYAAMVYDSRIGRVVLFGGNASITGGPANLFGDTWLWDGVSWQLAANNGPSPRFNHAMAYDSARGRTVLYGGATNATTDLNDVWEFNGSQWLSVANPNPNPGLRRGHVMAYGSGQRQMILFGGIHSGTNYNDTWQWSGTNWSLLATSGPGPRAFSAMAYNDNCDVMVLFGGNGIFWSDTWEWGGKSWTLISSNVPPQNSFHAMAHDSGAGQTILFSFTTTWAYSGTNSAQVISVYEICGQNKILVGFDSPIFGPSALNTNHYLFNCDQIVQVQLTDDPRLILLCTAHPLTNVQTCNLFINGVQDACGRIMKPYSGGEVRCTDEPCLGGSGGTEFWLTFPGNYAPDPVNPPQLSLFVAGAAGTIGTVAMPGLPSPFTTAFTIPAGGVASVSLPRTADLGDANDVIQSNAVHIIASQKVSVYGMNHVRFSSDAFLGLPVTAVGRTYMIMAYSNVFSDIPELNGSQFAIAGVQDGTTLTIIPSSDVGVHPAGVPYNLSIGKGQTYQLRNTNPAPADLTGTLIASDHPIAVFGSHQCANIPDANSSFCDHVVEQLFPATMWGTNFVTVPLATRTRADTFRCLALFNNTTLRLNGAVMGTASQGKFFQLQLGARAQIASDKPILVAQFANSSDFDLVTNADSFMVLVPPVQFFGPDYQIEASNDPIVQRIPDFFTNYVNVMAPAAAVGQITLDGVPIPGGLFAAISTSGYSGAQVPVTPGPHRISSASGQSFGLIAYGWNLYDGYAYPGGICSGLAGSGPSFGCPPASLVVTNGPDCTAPMPDLGNVFGGLAAIVLSYQTPATGTKLSPGVYDATKTIIDSIGGLHVCHTAVTVLDNPPGPRCPTNIIVTCANGAGVVVNYQAVSCARNSTVTCSPPSGSIFPPGTNTVNCAATVPGAVLGSCSFTVSVLCSKLNFARTNNALTLSWQNASSLQKATNIAGPWITLPATNNSFTVSVTEKQAFFRLKQ